MLRTPYIISFRARSRNLCSILPIQFPRPSYDAGPALDGTACDLSTSPSSPPGQCKAGQCISVSSFRVKNVAEAVEPKEVKSECRSGCLKWSLGYRVITSPEDGKAERMELCDPDLPQEEAEDNNRVDVQNSSESKFVVSMLNSRWNKDDSKLDVMG